MTVCPFTRCMQVMGSLSQPTKAVEERMIMVEMYKPFMIINP
jgi:hypothetical protein